MADVSIKIQLQDTIEDVIGGVSADKVTNNVSSIVSKNTQKNDGTPLLSFAEGYIKFDTNGNLVNADGKAGNAILEGTYNGFVFGATNASGEYSVTLTISGSHIDSLIFYGDKLANQFPVEAYLDGDTANKIYSDDNVWAIVFDTSTTSHSVTFTKWNRANYNACFTHIAVLRNELWLDKSWIKNIESVSQCTGQPNEIFYGVIANSGSAGILDRNGELLDYITDGIIDNSNLPVSIWANGKQVQAHITNDSDYDTNSITLSFEMTNDFDNWENINYEGFDYPDTSKNAYEMLCAVLNKLGYSTIEIDNMLNKSIIIGNSIDENVAEMSIKSYLQSIIISYPYLEADTIKNTIDKICVLAQLQVYKDDFDKIRFISARPVEPNDELSNAIIIPAKCAKSQFSEAKILKNKYDAIEISKYIINDDININSLWGTIYPDVNLAFSEANSQYANTSGTTSPVLHAIARVETYYITGEYLDYSKSSNHNLRQLSNIRNYDAGQKVQSTDWSLNYKKHSGDTQYTIYRVTSSQYEFRDNSKPANESYTSWDKGEDGAGKLDAPTLVTTLPGYGSTAEASLSDDSFITCSSGSSNSVFDVEFSILSKTIYYPLTGGGTQPPQSDYMIGSSTKYEPNKLSISIYGDVREISFDEISASSSNISESKNPAKITINNLISDKTVINNIEIVDIIKNNILSDYSNGISNASITIVCSSYYDVNGNLVKDWSKGEIIQVGEIVRIDKDNEGNSASNYKDGAPRLWRVIGRTFRKQGVPLIDLELQEIRQYFKVVFMNGDEVYATQLVDHGEKATAPSGPTVGTGYTFEGWFTADNQEFNFNTPINQDITLYAKIEPQQISLTYEISPNTTISIERLSSNKENATIGPITTSDTIYYNDQIKYVVSSSANFDYLGISVNDADTTSVNNSLTKIVTITEPTGIKTFIQNWILASKQSVNVNYPNNAGSATTDVVVNNYNSGEELRVNTTLYLHLKNKITNNIDTLNLYIGQSGSDWLTSPGYVPFGWAVPSSIYESYYPFSIDFEFSPQSADSDITITVTKENADDYVSSSGSGMSFYALRKS